MKADDERKMGESRLREERNQVDSEQRAAEAKYKNNAGTGLSGLALSKLLLCSDTVSHKRFWRSNTKGWFVSDLMLPNYG